MPQTSSFKPRLVFRDCEGGVSDRPAPGPGAQAPHPRGIVPSFFPRNVRVHLPKEMHATKPLGFTTQYSFSCTIFSCPPVLRLRPLGGACGQPPPPRGLPRCWSLTVAPSPFSFAPIPFIFRTFLLLSSLPRQMLSLFFQINFEFQNLGHRWMR